MDARGQLERGSGNAGAGKQEQQAARKTTAAPEGVACLKLLAWLRVHVWALSEKRNKREPKRGLGVCAFGFGAQCLVERRLSESFLERITLFLRKLSNL
jgi:hypothetical protein